MLKINYKDYTISQAKNNHVMICKDNKMLLHAQSDIKLDENGLKAMLDWYLFLIEKID